MAVEEGLRAHLLADGPVSAIVGTAIHPGSMPQGQTLPVLVYQRISTQRDTDLGGPMTFVKVRLQVDCWHNSYAACKSLADAVRVALNGVGLASPHLLGSEVVQLVELVGDTDLFEFDGDLRKYRVSQDWIITHLET